MKYLKPLLAAAPVLALSAVAAFAQDAVAPAAEAAAPQGEIVLAGFYDQPMQFAFPPAFMREVRIRVAAQWKPPELLAVRDLAESGRLSLDGLITHRSGPDEAEAAYRTAFDDPGCLKMILDWRNAR